MIKKLNKIGTYHRDTHGENQDALCHAQDRNYCVISLADGVSTCKEAKSGAEIASRAITDLLFKKGKQLMEFENGQIAEFALSHILYELKQYADDNSENVEEYASTVASVLVDKKKKRMLCFNLGDGIIMAVSNGKCHVITMPSDSSLGCYVTTTIGASSVVTVKLLDTDSIESVVICSDGAWKQMYNKNKLKPEVFEMLVNNKYDGVKDFLIKQKSFDDYSFISWVMQN